jgi:hypothetical protein
VNASDLQQLSVERGSATIVYQNGDSRRITRFDSITVQTNAGALEAAPSDPVGTGTQAGAEIKLDGTARGLLSASVLRLEDQRGHRAFSLGQVESITVEKYSPERPWLILAAAGVGAVAGGLLGYALGGPCNEEWGCLEKGLYSMAGIPIGFGVGLAIGFPLTRNLGEFQRAPDGATESRTYEP